MTYFTRKASEAAKAELIKAGWTHVSTVMTDSDTLRYGSHFIKGGIVYFLNKDTFIPGLTGDAMAQACAPIFNQQ